MDVVRMPLSATGHEMCLASGGRVCLRSALVSDITQFDEPKNRVPRSIFFGASQSERCLLCGSQQAPVSACGQPA
uniref:Uncharacterized protein n=1 Tax=Knipowitschia caucasica TaxID=637954 RepID=A0AAV2LN03_KNICA